MTDGARLNWPLLAGTQVAHDQPRIAISVENMLVAGDTKITDLLAPHRQGRTLFEPPR